MCAAVSGIPSCCAARHRSAGSPTGSAAASSSSRRASRGSRASRRAEALLDPGGQRQRRRQPETAGELGGRQPARQLQQRKRIPARLGDDPLEHGLVQPRRQDGLQQRPGIPASQRLDPKLREAGQSTAHLTRRERERDPLRQQAASHERERPGRSAVEPLRVVDHAQQRPPLGGFGEEAENREPDKKRAGRRSVAEPEGDAERVTLKIRKTLAELEDRRTELLQRRVVELHLPLDARSPDDAKILARLDRPLQQRRLADTGISVHHEDGAVTVPRGLQQPLQHRPLASPAQQPPRLRTDDHPGSMPPGSRTTGFRDAIARPGRRRCPRDHSLKGVMMTTAIIGVGNIGSTLARHFTGGEESVVLAAKDESRAEALANELGPLARAASVEDAIASADVVVFALWLDTTKELVPQYARLLENKVVVDPSNPLGFDETGKTWRTLPDDQSAASVVAALLPASAHYVKAFGTLGWPALAGGANREPRGVLFYATDDGVAATAIERLIRAAGFEPLKAGGVADAGRIEGPGGDLGEFGLRGELLDLDQARAAIAAGEVRA